MTTYPPVECPRCGSLVQPKTDDDLENAGLRTIDDDRHSTLSFDCPCGLRFTQVVDNGPEPVAAVARTDGAHKTAHETVLKGLRRLLGNQ